MVHHHERAVLLARPPQVAGVAEALNVSRKSEHAYVPHIGVVLPRVEREQAVLFTPVLHLVLAPHVQVLCDRDPGEAHQLCLLAEALG